MCQGKLGDEQCSSSIVWQSVLLVIGATNSLLLSESLASALSLFSSTNKWILTTLEYSTLTARCPAVTEVCARAVQDGAGMNSLRALDYEGGVMDMIDGHLACDGGEEWGNCDSTTTRWRYQPGRV